MDHTHGATAGMGGTDLSSPPEPLLSETSVNLRWLGAVQRLALATPLAILVLIVGIILVSIVIVRDLDPAILISLLIFIPVWLPYVWIYWRLRSKVAKTVKKSLALAIGFGAFALLFSLFICLLVLPDAETALVAGVFALLQLSLIVSAIRTYYTMRREPRDYRILLPRLVLGTFLLVLFVAAVLIPNTVKDRQTANESSAVMLVRTINTAQLSYAAKHPEAGFAGSLAELGPPPSADLIDARLAGGSRSGYIFSMIAGAPDAHGKIMKYSVTARPQTYNQTGTRSFFTDESGAIRYTRDNRVPTAQDPTLP